MKKGKKFHVGIWVIVVVTVFALAMVGCSDKNENSGKLTINGEDSGTEVDESDVRADNANTDGNGNNESNIEEQINVSNLTLSPYTESDFDASGKVLFKTEHAVINKEMDSISYTIENLSGSEQEYGDEYALEIKAGEQWYQVPFPEGYGWDSILYILPDNEIRGGILNLSWMDFEFADGDYRIVKKIGNYLVRAEFAMGESMITPGTPYGYESLEDLPLSYTMDEAIEDNVVVLGYKKSYNLDNLKIFVNNVKTGLPAMVRFGFSTIEGDPIFYDLIQNVTLDGRTWFTLYHDSRRDNFSAEEDRIITNNNYSYIVTDGISIYFSNFAEYADTELFHESSRGIYAGDYLCQPEIIDEIVKRHEEFTLEELQEEVELYKDIIRIIEEMTADRLECNVTRYKSFSPEGTYYVSLNEEQMARLPELQICGYPLAEDMDETVELIGGPVSFGFGTKGYGISDYIISGSNSDMIKQSTIIGVETVSWIDDETAVLKCATLHEGVHCNINFYPVKAMNKNYEAAFGEWEYAEE